MLELAAVAGCSPDPYTLRELVWMAEAADTAHWNRAWALMAQWQNLHRAKGAHAIDPNSFYPWPQAAQEPRDPTPEEDAMLRAAFRGPKQ